MNFEEELKAALQRREPSPDFAKRVMEQWSAGEPALNHSWRPYRAVAAALVMTAILGGWTVREVNHRRQGERAREEVLTALRITTEKLRTAQQHVHDIGSEK
ncbi:MAG TPA: hypothetical protein VFT12_09165 [Thermoanaerobaculia bacterium]|nr:hypothetical protein [Thermoanaerobaculia bacterium]